MFQIKFPRELFDVLSRERALGKIVGLVPTMGALHAGHFALIERAISECDTVCVSIFVNPLQFNALEDFERYPRHLAYDLASIEKLGVQVAFYPELEDLHLIPSQVRISVAGISEPMEGVFRSGHFDGVATVVSKLLIAAGPCAVYFGEKDYQQTRVIAELVREYHFPVEIRIVATLREDSGLALSSRNQLLSPAARGAAAGIYRAFELGKRAALLGELPNDVLSKMRVTMVETAASFDVELRIDYLELVGIKDLKPVISFDATSRFFCAASYDGVRLIDNMAVFE